MTRDEWKQVEKYLHDPKVREAMRGRCEEQGHQMDPGLTAMFQFVMICKWCGARQ
jgi:hypothetical protein